MGLATIKFEKKFDWVKGYLSKYFTWQICLLVTEKKNAIFAEKNADSAKISDYYLENLPKSS